MAYAPEHDPHKRKRDLDDDGGQPTHIHQPIGHEPTGRHPSLPAITPASESFINFLPRHHYAHLLGLLPGDVDTFGDIIYLISEYEGVLDRSESLAASLGAKLTGPRFLRGIERFFDGPIKTNSPHPYMHSITWLDVVTFAKANPDAFSLVSMTNGTRCCQFTYHGLQVEITEDDWRLISSGALDKFPLEHIFEEDEEAELATLEILLQRSSVLYKKADEVAARARLLHRRLDTRRMDVARQRQPHDDSATASSSSGSGHVSGFYAVNHPPRNSIPGPGGSSSHHLHSELLHQFTMASMQNLPPPGPPPGYQQQPTFGPSVPAIATGHRAPPLLEAPPYQPLPSITYAKIAMAPATAATATTTAATATAPSASVSTLASILAPAPVSPSPSPSPSASASVSTPSSTSIPPAPASTPVPPPTPVPASNSASKPKSKAKSARGSRRAVPPNDPATEVHRSLVLQKADTVHKGDVIFPPCDRCRRLRLQCVKHLSACRGCTRKHARCNWRNVTDEEAETVRHQLEIIEREAQKAREAATTSTSSAALASTPQSEANSGSTSGSGASSSSTASLVSQVELVSRPALASAPSPAPAPGPGLLVEPLLKLVPTSRLTRIEPAPTVQRNPPRTGHLAAILSPPDYEPRPFHTLSSLAPR